jgi:antitoxin ParD1/3/4
MNIFLKPEHEKFIKELRQKIEVGAAQIVKGQTTDGELVFARLQEKLTKYNSQDRE